MSRNLIIIKLFLVVSFVYITGCASLDSRSKPFPNDLKLGVNAQLVIFSAVQFIDVPYVYGGTSMMGVDCSGLVYLAYLNAGYPIPRTSVQQYKNARIIDRNELSPGDLVFFDLDRGEVSHVGIYMGKSRFVHAPRTGKKVSYASLENPFWHQRWIASGRYH